MTDLHLPDPQINGGGTLIPPPPLDTAAAKRHRRPSVRLGDIGGDLTFDSLPTRKPKKIARNRNETLENEEREANFVAEWRSRDSKPKTKRVRSTWGFSRGNDDEVDDDMDDDVDDDLENRVSKDFEPSDTDWNGGGEGERNGIRVWLNQLGLGRYAPVFEIHEVDDEVLPMLTIEDLKDMGINAVGSRRKMYCAIQKLSKGFS